MGQVLLGAVGLGIGVLVATTKPISVLVLGMDPQPELEAMAAEGHTVQYLPIDEGVDVVLGPRCWRYLPDVSAKFLSLMLKEARAKQPPRAKKAKVKRGTPAS